jgi:ribosomal protein S1
MTGEVKRVTQFGVFILLSNSTLSALSHISQVSDKPVTYQQLQSYYNEGDKVKYWQLIKQKIELMLD